MYVILYTVFTIDKYKDKSINETINSIMKEMVIRLYY
jgi:hypothetical protein